MRQSWKPGDWAVYRKSKRSVSPGRRAESVFASPKGESYTYVVDKFWVVEEILPGNRLRLKTARGKVHEIDADDPSLRRPSVFQRLFRRDRFRVVEQGLETPHFAA